MSGRERGSIGDNNSTYLETMPSSKCFLPVATLRTHPHDSPPAVSDRKNTLCSVDRYNRQQIGLNRRGSPSMHLPCTTREPSWRKETEARLAVPEMSGPVVSLL